MTIKPNKPNRTELERERHEEKVRWLKRRQEEEDAKKTLKWYLEHPEEDPDAPTE